MNQTLTPSAAVRSSTSQVGVSDLLFGDVAAGMTVTVDIDGDVVTGVVAEVPRPGLFWLTRPSGALRAVYAGNVRCLSRA